MYVLQDVYLFFFRFLVILYPLSVLANSVFSFTFTIYLYFSMSWRYLHPLRLILLLDRPKTGSLIIYIMFCVPMPRPINSLSFFSESLSHLTTLNNHHR